MASLFEIRLSEVLVIENGTIKTVEGINTLSISFFYASPGKPSLTSLRSLNLIDKEPFSFQDKRIKDRVIFKDWIYGECEIEVEISAIEKVSKIEKFIFNVFGKAVNAGLNLITGGVSSLITGAASDFTDSVLEKASPKDKISVIGKCTWLLKEDMSTDELTLQCSVPKTVKFTQRYREGDKIIEKIKTLNQGFNNAQVKLQILKLDSL